MKKTNASTRYRDQQKRVASRTGPVLLLTFDDKGVALPIRFLRRELNKANIDATCVLVNTRSTNATAVFEKGRALAKLKPRLLGLSMMSDDVVLARTLIGGFRAVDKDAVIIAGGVHATVDPESTVQVVGVDAAIRGVGEQALITVLSEEQKDRPCGWHTISEPGEIELPVHIAQAASGYMDPINVVEATEHGLQKLSRKRLIELSHWNASYYHTITSLGCPYSCSYCANIYRTTPSRRHVSQVLEEVVEARSRHPHLEGVNFHDDSFHTGDNKWLQEFLTCYAKVHGGPFVIRLMPRMIDRNLAMLLKDSGLKLVKIGLQGSDRLNRWLYNRRETSARFCAALD